MTFRGAGRVAAAGVVAVFAGLVSGCALLAPPATPSHSPAPTRTPDAVPLVQRLPALLVAGQTIGSGVLRAIDHEPVDDRRADHPLTGQVRIVVGSDMRIDVRIRPDDPASASLSSIDLLLTPTRHDGKPENIQVQSTLRFGLISDLDTVAPGGELVLPVMGADVPALGDPSFLHSIEETLPGDGRVFAAADLTWTLPSPYPGLRVTDRGPQPFARGTAQVEDGAVVGYTPNPYDTIYAVTRRFGVNEVQLLWLNPWMIAPDPELTAGMGINLDPARR